MSRIAQRIDDIRRRLGLEAEVPRSVEVEVRALLDDPGLDDPRLLDLTSLPFVTIDNEDSRDLDQAVHVEACDEGGRIRVRYALADASYYAPVGSALFEDALSRGATFYAPDRAVPMLPPELSEGLVSLNPGVDRRALVFCHILDPEGTCLETRVVRARIRSRAQLSYRGVQQHIDEGDAGRYRDEPFAESLELLFRIGRRLIEAARRRDVVPHERREVAIRVAPDGEGLAAGERTRHESDRVNEQISILCNTEGGRLLGERGVADAIVQPVFRVHEAPPEASLARLERILPRLMALHGLEAPRWSWRRGRETLADYLERLTTCGPGPRLVQAVERQIMQTNQRSNFRADPGPHHALKVPLYSRFSSPMREIVGIFTHKEFLEAQGEIPPGDPGRDRALREAVIRAGNRARDLQSRLSKEVVGLLVDDWLREDLTRAPGDRERRRGTVIGLTSTRLYVRLDGPPLELKVYLKSLPEGGAYRLEEDELSLVRTGASPERFRLGDAVELVTHAFEEKRGRWIFYPRRLDPGEADRSDRP